MLFFQLINARHERASTVLTSNKGFEEWGGVLGDESWPRRSSTGCCTTATASTSGITATGCESTSSGCSSRWTRAARESRGEGRPGSLATRFGPDSGRSAPCVRPETPRGNRRENVRSARDALPQSVKFSVAIDTGKPRNRRPSSTWRGVYPRGRGEARVPHGEVNHAVGLSPRARGSLCGRGRPGWASGSIPAGAGEAQGRASAQAVRAGLSPRARGSPVALDHLDRFGGSIPAGAGKPMGDFTGVRAPMVYPRGRGEAQFYQPGESVGQGLSPRARGSLAVAVRRPGAHGSIPAGAGKPCHLVTHCPDLEVYPRGRGEASARLPRTSMSTGLSPLYSDNQDENLPTIRMRESPPLALGGRA